MHPLSDLDVPLKNVAIHWFEQSSFAIKDASGTLVQIDPFFPQQRPADRFIYDEPPLDESQLPTDYILLTHAHLDHTYPQSLERIRQVSPNAQVIGPAESIKQVLAETGFVDSAVTIISAGESASMGSMQVQAVYAKPPEGDPAANIQPPDVTHLGYVLQADGVSLYFSGDPINTFAEHDALTEPIAALKPDLGFLTNHPNEGEFPFYDGSVKVAQRTGLTYAAPSHYACFVKRTYDPTEWAAQFPADGPKILIVPRNSHILFPQVTKSG